MEKRGKGVFAQNILFLLHLSRSRFFISCRACAVIGWIAAYIDGHWVRIEIREDERLPNFLDGRTLPETDWPS